MNDEWDMCFVYPWSVCTWFFLQNPGLTPRSWYETSTRHQLPILLSRSMVEICTSLGNLAGVLYSILCHLEKICILFGHMQHILYPILSHLEGHTQILVIGGFISDSRSSGGYIYLILGNTEINAGGYTIFNGHNFWIWKTKLFYKVTVLEVTFFFQNAEFYPFHFKKTASMLFDCVRWPVVRNVWFWSQTKS